MPCSHIKPSDTTGSKFASDFVFHARQSTTISGCVCWLDGLDVRGCSWRTCWPFGSFLVACYATLHHALSVRPSVRHTLLFFGFPPSVKMCHLITTMVIDPARITIKSPLMHLLVPCTRLYALPCRSVRPSVTFLNCELFDSVHDGWYIVAEA